jgi:hypothetical protein
LNCYRFINAPEVISLFPESLPVAKLRYFYEKTVNEMITSNC